MVDQLDSEDGGLLTYKFENREPVALDDLLRSLNGFNAFYEEYLLLTGHPPEKEGIRLYVRELQSGSIIASLQAIADQAHLIFGDGGVLDSIKDGYDHAKSLSGFVTHLNELVQWLLGARSSGLSRPTTKEAKNIIDFLEPVARDSGSNIAIQFNAPIHVEHLTLHIDSQQANAIQNRAKRLVEPALPLNQTHPDELLVLHQVRGVPSSRAGDLGIIESISSRPVRLVFSSDDLKRAIIELPENPFQQAYLVDVEVRTVDGKPALYKILNLKDSIDRP